MGAKTVVTKFGIGILITLLAKYSFAGIFNFEGAIANQKDVVLTAFSLVSDTSNVRLWTDSYDDGENFDPITALWNASTGQLIYQNDDNASVSPGTQTRFDSGFLLDGLAAGDYLLSVAAYNNWAAGTSLLEGFEFDSQEPIALQEWCQPVSSCDMGPNWSVWLDGVDFASNQNAPVPEPSALILLLVGFAGLGLARKRIHHGDVV